MKKIIPIFILVVFLSQCKNHYDYSEMENVNNIWLKNDTLQFNFEINNPKDKKNISFIVRNNDEYPFSNLYLFIKLKKGNKTIIDSDTVSYAVADKTGKWLGTGMGATKEIYYEYKNGIIFPEAGEYTLSIVQAMRKDTLKGIEDFGVTIK